jgi:hypothetical protein
MIKKENSIATDIVNNEAYFMIFSIKNSIFSEKSIDIQKNYIFYNSSSKFPLFNGLYCFSLENEDEFLFSLKKSIAFFKKKNTNFSWWWLNNACVPNFVLNKLNELGFKKYGTYTGIALELENYNLKKIDNKLVIRKVSTKAEYESFVSIVSNAFSFDFSTTNDFYHLQNFYENPNTVEHYIGYHENIPVTVMTLFINENVVGIYNAATVIKYRKTGFYSELLNSLLFNLKTREYTLAVSQLAPDGMARGIFDGIGFKNFCHLEHYLFLFE